MTAALARRTDPSTSHEAAHSITAAQLRKSQDAVLRVLKAYGPLDDLDLIQQYSELEYASGLPQQSESGLRTRRKELVDLGFVADSGLKSTMPSGRRAILWAAI